MGDINAILNNIKSSTLGVGDDKSKRIKPDNTEVAKASALSGLIDSLDTDVTAPSKTFFGDAESYEKYGVTVNNIDKDLDRQRANNQSALEQFGHSLVQGVGGEIIGGTISGFGAIGDVIVGAALDDNNDYKNPITELGDNIRSDIQDKFPIYQTDPNASLDFGDTGYIFNRLPSVLSSLSLLIPGKALTYGGGKLASAVGNIARASKLGKTIETAAKAGEYGQAIKAATSVNTINKIKSYAESGVTAIGMRIGENYQEARQTHEQVKEETGAYLNSLDDKAYNKWVVENKSKFGNIDYNDKDVVANTIASKAADRTFAIDMGNVLFDFIQLRALSSAWKNMATRPATFAARQANKSAINTIAQKAIENAAVGKKSILASVGNRINKSIWNTGVVTMSELSEGVEEGVNYIAQQEGALYGRQLRNQLNKGDDANLVDKATNYLRDPQLYDSALWGVIGGVVFHGLAEGANSIKNKIQHVENDTNEKTRLAEINGRRLKWDVAQRNIADVNNGINPFEIDTDEIGNPIIDESGKPKYKAIESEEEKEQLKETINQRVISSLALDAIKVGNFALLKDYVNNPQLKPKLVELGLSSDEDYDSYSAKINEIVDKTKDQFDKYSALLHNANVSDAYLDIAISNNIANENTVEELKSKISLLQNKNNKIATDNPTINSMRLDGNIDSKFKAGLLQGTLVESERQLAKLKDTNAKPAEITNAENSIKSIKSVLESYKTSLSPIESLKARMQYTSLSGIEDNELNKDIEAFKATEEGKQFDDAKNIFSLSAIETFATNVNKDYVDNISDQLYHEIQMNRIDGNIIHSQKEAEQGAIKLQTEMKEEANKIVDNAKQSIQGALNSEDKEEVYKHLKGQESTLDENKKKVLDDAKDILIQRDKDKYDTDLDIEYNKAVGRPPVKVIEQVVTPAEPKTKAKVKAKAKEPIITKYSIETVSNEESAVKLDNSLSELSNDKLKLISDKDLSDNEFSVIKPFTYKGKTFDSIDIIKGNFGNTSIIISDTNGNEETIDNKQLSYLTYGNYISLTGSNVESEIIDDTKVSAPQQFEGILGNDELPAAPLPSTELFSSIDETESNSIDKARDRFNKLLDIVKDYSTAVNRKLDNGKTRISYEDLMRYVVDNAGINVASNLATELKLTLEYMANVEDSIIITDNQDTLNKSDEDFSKIINTPKADILKTNIEKDANETSFQVFVTDKITNRVMKTAKEVSNYNAIMSIKNGDRVQGKINDKGAVEIYKNRRLIGALPAVKISNDGRYRSTNEFWNYNIGLKKDVNLFEDDFINRIKTILDNSSDTNNDNFLTRLENLRTVINNNGDIQSAINFLENDYIYSDLVKTYSSNLTTNEDKLKRAKHILKLFGYNSNIDITMSNAYPVIKESLNRWVDKLGTNYSNIDTFKKNIIAGKNFITIKDVTSGKLIKATNKDGSKKFSSVSSNITSDSSDGYKLYFPTKSQQGTVLLQEGNPNTPIASDEYIASGAPTMFIKDSNGRNIRVYLYPNVLLTGKVKTTPEIEKLGNSVFDLIYKASESLLSNDIESFENTITSFKDYVGNGKLLYGIDVKPIANGYVLNFSNGYALFMNYKNGVSITPYFNNKPIKTSTGFNVSYKPSGENVKYTPQQSVASIKRNTSPYINALRVNYMKDGILNNRKPLYIVGDTDKIYNDTEGKFNIQLPNGEKLIFNDYKSFLLDNNLMLTDVDAVRDSKGNILGNFIESGDGIGFDKNFYIALGDKKRKSRSKTSTKKADNIRSVVENANSLEEISNVLGTTNYNPIFKLLDSLGVNVNNKILSNENIDANAKFNVESGTISIFDKWFDIDNNDRKARILVHEGLHFYFTQLENNKELKDRFIKVYDYYKNAVNVETNKDTKAFMSKFILNNESEDINLEEFIVESLTNKDLITILNNIQVSDVSEEGTSKSLFKQILDLVVDLISNAAGINNNSLLAEVNSIVTTFEEESLSNRETEARVMTDDSEIVVPVKSITTDIVETIEDDLSKFDDYIDDDFALYSIIDESDNTSIGSINGFRNSLNESEKVNFDALYDAGAINIVCQ